MKIKIKLACVKASVARKSLGQEWPCGFESHFSYYTEVQYNGYHSRFEGGYEISTNRMYGEEIVQITTTYDSTKL